MNIGKPKRVITVEPLQDPVPRRAPAPTPQREEPARPTRKEKEKVPA